MSRPPPPAEPQWPPRSPHEARMGTPGGRERLRRMAERTSPSPSPMRRARGLNGAAGSQVEGVNNDANAGADEDDEDEETLELKMQLLQARLKLKRLQKDKPKAQQEKADDATRAGLEHAPSPTKTQATRQDRPPSSQPIVIPASPVRRVQAPETQTSPSRVLLGIDKGLKAKDVSLRRAPSLRKRPESQAAPSASMVPNETPRPLSFNERLAAARTEEEERRERQERIRRMRTNAFGISKDEMEGLKSAAVAIPNEELRPPEYSRDEVLRAPFKPAAGSGLEKSNPTPRVFTQEPAMPNANLSENQRPVRGSAAASASFESYSSFHLTKRIMPHGTLARQLKGKKVYSVKDLLREVKSPNYELPDVEEDIVVFAIVAGKSDPRSHKPENGLNASDRTKYMVITIVDLEWELELFLFNGGFTRFWKLVEGTVIAILNPSIMPPPRAKTHSGKFSLVINSDADTIIEIGTSRDLGYCKSMKKDGQLCNSWVNKKRTEFCEFHANEIVRKARSSRMEVNQTGFGREYKQKPRVIKRFPGDPTPTPAPASVRSRNGTYDHETGTHWFVSKSMSAATLIDGVADRKQREEALKKRVIAREKEHQLIKALSKTGSGAGQEYMRVSGTQPTTSSSTSAVPSQALPDARDLGLIGNRGNTTISLSPVKRKRPDSSQSITSTDTARAGLGWGGGLYSKLARMKEGEKLAPEAKEPQLPVKKKTRFITSKGIREAGRESLGEELSSRKVELDDDDDELIILR
ncbi:related to replication protein CDC23 [Cephalotrichum gorgonifer]|uniref:Related to replication protein CDC23 n=1 Tax=Cephalotrichum gorgonifer TaxID=2041049 RepID=A0AAE8N4N6_9PEZI|nr:related to replication protein CDC23 [Cephalotrichum gorgonifer]